MPELETTGAITQLINQIREDQLRAKARGHQQDARDALAGEPSISHFDSARHSLSEAENVLKNDEAVGLAVIKFLQELNELGITEPPAEYLHQLAPQTIVPEVPISELSETDEPAETIQPKQPETESQYDMAALQQKLGKNLTEMTRAVVTDPTVPLVETTQTPAKVELEALQEQKDLTFSRPSSLQERTKATFTFEDHEFKSTQALILKALTELNATRDNPVTFEKLAELTLEPGASPDQIKGRISSLRKTLADKNIQIPYSNGYYLEYPENKPEQTASKPENKQVEISISPELAGEIFNLAVDSVFGKDTSKPFLTPNEQGIFDMLTKNTVQGTGLTAREMGQQYAKPGTPENKATAQARTALHRLRAKGVEVTTIATDEGTKYFIETEKILAPVELTEIPSSPVETHTTIDAEEGNQVVFSEELPPASTLQQPTEELDMTIFDLSPEDWKEEGKKQNGHAEVDERKTTEEDEMVINRKYLNEEQAKKVIQGLSNANSHTFFDVFRPQVMEELNLTSQEAEVFLAEVITYHPEDFKNQWTRSNGQVKTDIAGIITSEIGIRKGKLITIQKQEFPADQLPEETEERSKKKDR